MSCEFFVDDPAVRVSYTDITESDEVLPGQEVYFYATTDYIEDTSSMKWYVDGIPTEQKGSNFIFQPETPGKYTIEARISYSSGTLFDDPAEYTDSKTVTVSDKYNYTLPTNLPVPALEIEQGYDKMFSQGNKLLIKYSVYTLYYSDDRGINFTEFTLPEDAYSKNYTLIPGDTYAFATIASKSSYTDSVHLYKKGFPVPDEYITTEELKTVSGLDMKSITSIHIDGSQLYVLCSYNLNGNWNSRVYVFDLTQPKTFNNYWDIPVDTRIDIFYTGGDTPLILDFINNKEITLNRDFTTTVNSSELQLNIYFQEIFSNDTTLLIGNSTSVFLKSTTGWEKTLYPRSIINIVSDYLIFRLSRNLIITDRASGEETSIFINQYETPTNDYYNKQEIMMLNTGDYLFFHESDRTVLYSLNNL